jgi:hypothetical protein
VAFGNVTRVSGRKLKIDRARSVALVTKQLEEVKALDGPKYLSLKTKKYCKKKKFHLNTSQ